MPDTLVQHNWIETNCAVTSPKASLTDGEPSLGSKEKRKSSRRSSRSSRRKRPFAKEEVVRLTGVVDEAQKSATQSVEELKRHTKVATSLQGRLDALTSERLEEHGEVREARPQAPPRRRDVEPAALWRDPYRQRERSNYPSQTPPDDQESGMSQSSAAPLARSRRALSTPQRAPPLKGYQAVPPATGYRWVCVEGQWQQERLPMVQEPQRNPRSANCYQEFLWYGPKEEEDDIDVSDRSGISLEDMLDQEFEELTPSLKMSATSPTTWIFLPWEPKPRMKETVNDMALNAIGSPEVECQY